jgi:hypothetical protein
MFQRLINRGGLPTLAQLQLGQDIEAAKIVKVRPSTRKGKPVKGYTRTDPRHAKQVVQSLDKKYGNDWRRATYQERELYNNAMVVLHPPKNPALRKYYEDQGLLDKAFKRKNEERALAEAQMDLALIKSAQAKVPGGVDRAELKRAQAKVKALTQKMGKPTTKVTSYETKSGVTMFQIGKLPPKKAKKFDRARKRWNELVKTFEV